MGHKIHYCPIWRFDPENYGVIHINTLKDDKPLEKFKGDRDLSPGEIEAIEELKGVEAHLGSILTAIQNEASEHGDKEAGRWLSEARTCLETGMMFAIKAVARPSNGLGRRSPK